MPRNDDETTVEKSYRNMALEPRVAALEVGLDRLTADVKDLANVVRRQGENVEQEIQKLVVAVTQAQGPKKTDWSTIFAGVMLIMAIGSAVFWPLNQKTDYMISNVSALQTKFESHEKMDNHPVGAALIQRLENQVVALQTEQIKRADEDRRELQEWQGKAMGLTSPDKTTVLAPKDIQK